ncbi:non-histone chromosomal protein 6-like [Galendromus occidentalis]|uniref:Non-histone chromosomal protein 6-like n=1 Tax=Galendromus occidentalis TaxID=34638 RepID=A0AAJ6VXH7_9ACAR|nr:non-histone chromosomal protein 6-like [Galendromus occidentalis]
MSGLDIFITQVEGEFVRLSGYDALEKVHDELTSRCMDAWLAMEPRLRSYFNNSETALSPQPRQGSGGRTRIRKQARNSRLPKRPLTAYFVYCREKRPLVHLEKPELKHIELTRELANRWNNLSSEEREPYDIAAQMDRKRYNDEMALMISRQDPDIDEDSASESRVYNSPEISEGSDSSRSSPASSPFN